MSAACGTQALPWLATAAAAPIDPARVGMVGWSYGGYMAMWAPTQSQRFKAVVAGAVSYVVFQSLRNGKATIGGSVQRGFARLLPIIPGAAASAAIIMVLRSIIKASAKLFAKAYRNAPSAAAQQAVMVINAAGR